MPKVVIDQPCELLSPAKDGLARVGEVWVPHSFERHEFVRLAMCADAILSWSGVPINRELLESAPRLQIVAVAATGYDHVDVEAATELGIVVANQPGASADSVAEFAIFLIIGLLRKALPALQATKRGKWLPLAELGGRELCGKTAGVIGLGRIGTRVSTLLVHFGCRVLGYDPHLPAGRWPPAVQSVPLDELLRQADVVTLHVPGTAETRGLLGRRELEGLKAGAVLVNTARSPVVDERVLTELLQAGRLDGAALDVFPEEPPDLSRPLYQLPNVVVSPHMAALTEEALLRYELGVVEAIAAVLVDGRWPDTAVNRREDVPWRFMQPLAREEGQR